MVSQISQSEKASLLARFINFEDSFVTSLNISPFVLIFEKPVSAPLIPRIFSSFDEGNNDDDMLSQNLDVVLDISDSQCGLSDDSDECSI